MNENVNSNKIHCPYQVGDQVRCIGDSNRRSDGRSSAGWQENLIFTITKISNREFPTILWGGLNCNGVYEDQVEIVKTKEALEKERSEPTNDLNGRWVQLVKPGLGLKVQEYYQIKDWDKGEFYGGYTFNGCQACFNEYFIVVDPPPFHSESTIEPKKESERIEQVLTAQPTWRVGDYVRLDDGCGYANLQPGEVGMITSIDSNDSFSVNNYGGCAPRCWKKVEINPYSELIDKSQKKEVEEQPKESIKFVHVNLIKVKQL